MNPVEQLVMYGWVLLTVYFFSAHSPQKAVVLTVFGGMMFMPMATYDLPGIPAYTKYTAMSFGILLGSITSSAAKKYSGSFSRLDLPMLFWCSAVPVLTYLSNGLGLYGGVSSAIENITSWGVFYWAGRKYFRTEESLRYIVRIIIVSAVLYIPFLIFELINGPYLHQLTYGWMQHLLDAHIRYGGYRPMVFMQSGLLVAFFMSIAAVFAFWKWRNQRLDKIGFISGTLAVILLIFFAILCKSANGWIYLLMGIGFYYVPKNTTKIQLLKLLILFSYGYMVIRAFNVVSVEFIGNIVSKIFDEDRTMSLLVRLYQEDSYGARAFQRPIFGWGGYDRGVPVDPYTGLPIWDIIDGKWTIVFSQYGLFGLFSLFVGIGIGPLVVLKYIRNEIVDNKLSEKAYNLILLSGLIAFFLVDNLINAMHNPVAILCAGILVSQAEAYRRRESGVLLTTVDIN